MTDVDVSPGQGRSRWWSNAAGWIKAKDPNRLAIKRSIRAAVVMPLVFGITHLIFSNAQISLFGAFGSFALLLMVDFQGRPRTRLVSYLGLFLVGGCFISVGTVASTHKVVAVVAMAVVGFAVLYAGVLSPQVATASTAALLTFVLPVAVAQPANAVGPRLVGWVIASTCCITACMVIWPTPWHDNLRRRLSATVTAVSQLTATYADGRLDSEGVATVQSELARLQSQFAGTPYPPISTAADAVALAKLVGRVEWLATTPVLAGADASALQLASVRTVLESVTDTLRLSASLICDGQSHPVDDPALIQAVQDSILQLHQVLAAELDAEVSVLIDPGSSPESVKLAGGGSGPEAGQWQQGIASSLDPSFRVRALGTAAEMVADATLEAGGTPAVVDRPVLNPGRSSVLWYRFTSRLSFRSVWFRNALRGAAGLALAVTVVEITAVEHGFWVVLGALSVLRSNALDTGATALRAVGGTAVGFVAGSAIMIGVANHLALLWVLLPLAVLVSGVAPTMISFAAGQAGFTLVVVILFNIIQPIGWQVGLTRIEDVAIGCAVSIVVGLLFWPRGATAALGRALSEAFVTSSGYLADAVDRLTTSTRQVDTGPGRMASHNAYLRLDDAFRQFLVERGAKVVPVDTVASLFTGSNRIRLAAFTLAALPVRPSDPDQPELESVAVAGSVLRDSYASSHRWYEEFAEVLIGRRQSLDPPPVHDQVLSDVLQEAFEDARGRRRGDRLRTTLQMLWADELLETQAQVQTDLANSADLFARQRHQRPMI
jgi:uncharacterized membrane protein YccC